MDMWLCQTMGGHAAEYNPSLSGHVAETIALGERLEKETGRWPAFLFLTAHAPTQGPFQWVRFELLRQGQVLAFDFSQAGREKRLKAGTPQCLLAVDPYALDSVPMYVGAIYAAFIRQVYFAYDRQFSTQSFFQRFIFLRKTGFPWAGWRLLRRLRRGIPVLMAFGGGIAVNARLLYAAREFVQRLHFPKKVSRRQAEYDWVRLLEGQDHDDPAIEGVITADTERALLERLEQWGFPKEKAQEALRLFGEEFAHAVPYRERLWRVLLHRIVKHGQGLVVVSGDYAASAPHISLGHAHGFYWTKSGELRYVQGKEEKSLGSNVDEAARIVALEFSKSFRRDS